MLHTQFEELHGNPPNRHMVMCIGLQPPWHPFLQPQCIRSWHVASGRVTHTRMVPLGQYICPSLARRIWRVWIGRYASIWRLCVAPCKRVEQKESASHVIFWRDHYPAQDIDRWPLLKTCCLFCVQQFLQHVTMHVCLDGSPANSSCHGYGQTTAGDSRFGICKHPWYYMCQGLQTQVKVAFLQ